MTPLAIDGKIFKAYDIRGLYPAEINEATVRRIAGAYASYLRPKVVAAGRDVRVSSPTLHQSVIDGLTEAGVDVVDIGLVPTDMLYFAVGYLKLDGGIQVSASHNPAEYNGLKLIKAGVEALSNDDGLPEIKELTRSDQNLTASTRGRVTTRSVLDDYIAHLAGLVNLSTLPALKLAANSNFGATGPVFEQLAEKLKLPLVLERLNFEPDGTFPKGRPDPSVPENRSELSMLVRSSSANLGVAWDADGDRCFIVDENGEFIEGCHLTALLAAHLLKKYPGQKIIHDPRNIWAVEETVRAAGGTPILNRVGHTFIKQRMKKEGALFAGEMSGHFYFRDFFDADNGILPLLYFLEIIAQTGQTASQIVAPLREKFFVSGEISFRVDNIQKTIADVLSRYSGGSVDTTDGTSVSFETWRFNLRPSNTESLLRLNVEAKNRQDCTINTYRLTEYITYHALK